MGIKEATESINEKLSNSNQAIVSSIFIICLDILKEESVSPCPKCANTWETDDGSLECGLRECIHYPQNTSLFEPKEE